MKPQNPLRDPDGFYQTLVKMHDGLSVEQSLELNARVILLMAAEIGDEQILHQLLQRAIAKDDSDWPGVSPLLRAGES